MQIKELKFNQLNARLVKKTTQQNFPQEELFFADQGKMSPTNLAFIYCNIAVKQNGISLNFGVTNL